MAPAVGPQTSSERTAMEKFGGGGMALLPWTKHILTALWEQLRLLLQVLYCHFMSVFQMFRFEVHVRITDETGQHIQHMATATNQAESFLFSSLFDGENGVVIGGSNPLSNFCEEVSDPFTGKATAEALLSSLRADDLCCGIVDDFVSGKEEGIFLGHHSSWKMGFPGEWNIFMSSSDSSSSGETCNHSTRKAFKQDTAKKMVFNQDPPEEEKSFQWSSEEDPSVVEFESEESKALWESLSKSSDPYNPFFFSASITTNTGKSRREARDGSDSEMISVNHASEEMLGPQGLNIWVSRSDSESSWSSSDGSNPDIDKEENERLWDFFSSPADPFNPMCFTACTVSSAGPAVAKQQAPLHTSFTSSGTDEKEGSCTPSSEDGEDQLWRSLCLNDDPYHPLNFQARLQSSPTAPAKTLHRATEDSHTPEVHFTINLPTNGRNGVKSTRKNKVTKPRLPERQLKHHSHPDTTMVPWKRAGHKAQSPTEEKSPSKADNTPKKVRFSPLVHVHVMRSWPFARQASRKGHWEEFARDRERFRRRVQETERAIDHCLTPSHRQKIWARLEEGALN